MPGHFYRLNFSDFDSAVYGDFHSQQLGFDRQGYELAAIIQAVLDANPGASKVALVAHSMGGLIVRSYLAGLQTNGTYQPPVNPKVRKYVQIATPNFGSAFAAALAQHGF